MKLLSMLTAGFLVFSASFAVAEGDVNKGKKLFKKCASCHMIGENARNKVGPSLNNIMDAQVGGAEGYKYSKAIKKAAAEGLVWNDETLDAFLKKPRKYMKGTKMSYAGLKKEKDRKDIIAYLRSFSSQ